MEALGSLLHDALHHAQMILRSLRFKRWKQEDKLIAAHAGNHIVWMATIPERIRNHPQHPVPCEVTMPVIHRLERIEVKHSDRKSLSSSCACRTAASIFSRKWRMLGSCVRCRFWRLSLRF